MQPNKQNHEKQHRRTTKDSPWCWQSKSSLKRVTMVFSESNQSASARSIYVALSELASDAGAETFTAAKSAIASSSGLSIRTVTTLLHGLEELGLIRIERGTISSQLRLKTANRYTLLSIGSDCTSMGNNAVAYIRRKGKEQGFSTRKTKGARAACTTFFSPKIPYPKSEEEMVRLLDSLGVECDPTYDGQFFKQMEKSNWTIRSEPVWDWPATYKARLEKTSPPDFDHFNRAKKQT